MHHDGGVVFPILIEPVFQLARGIEARFLEEPAGSLVTARDNSEELVEAERTLAVGQEMAERGQSVALLPIGGAYDDAYLSS